MQQAGLCSKIFYILLVKSNSLLRFHRFKGISGITGRNQKNLILRFGFKVLSFKFSHFFILKFVMAYLKSLTEMAFFKRKPR